MTSSTLVLRGFTTAALVVLAAAAVGSTAIRELRRSGSEVGTTQPRHGDIGAPGMAWPAWFAPIAHSYRGAEGITPIFDYASLYGAPALDAKGDVLRHRPAWPWNRTTSTSIFSSSSLEAKK
jgi:hypothetical protein